MVLAIKKNLVGTRFKNTVLLNVAEVCVSYLV